MAHRVAPRAETDLDDIWLYVARESGSVEIANRLIDTITNRFLTLAQFPYIGRSREDDFGPGYRSLAGACCLGNVEIAPAFQGYFFANACRCWTNKRKTYFGN